VAGRWGNIDAVSADGGPGSDSGDAGPAGSDDHDSDPPQSAGRFAAVAFAVLLYFPIKDLFDSHPSATLGVGDDPKRWAPLFIFVSAVVGVRVALPWAAYGIAACTVVSAAVLTSTAPIDKTLTIAIETLAVGALMVGMGRLRATISELQEAREQLARMAVTEERLRFARDLHDLLGHSLSVIALKADFAGRLLPADAERAAKEIAEIDSVARQALAEVRDAVSGYRQPTLSEAVAAGRLALDAAGIDTSYDIAQVALPPVLDAVLAWAMREAITNVIRHSQARHCWIHVTAGLVEAAAEVIDDGIGGPNDTGVSADPGRCAPPMGWQWPRRIGRTRRGTPRSP